MSYTMDCRGNEVRAGDIIGWRRNLKPDEPVIYSVVTDFNTQWIDVINLNGPRKGRPDCVFDKDGYVKKQVTINFDDVTLPE